MTSAILGLLEQVIRLGVLTFEEKHRYEDDILKLKKEYYEELYRPDDEISHNRLDDIQLELRLLSEAVIQTLGTKKA